MYITCKAGRFFVGRLERGTDLLDGLVHFCEKKDIFLGQLQVIGAVQAARIGWYDQVLQKYTRPKDLTGGYEIISCCGTISTMENRPHIHAHIQLSGEDCRTYGGHLYTGTQVYNAEFIINEIVGPRLKRDYDNYLKAPVWFANNTILAQDCNETRPWPASE